MDERDFDSRDEYPVRRRRLLRDPRNGVILGICTGLAHYLRVEPWIVRAATVLLAFGAPGIVIPAYLIAYFVLDDRDLEDDIEHKRMSRRSRRIRRSRRRAEVEESSKRDLGGIRRRYDGLEYRLRRLEHFVTSGRYEFEREFRKL